MTFTEAQAAAHHYVTEQAIAIGVPLTLMDGETLEWEFGWVFFYSVDRAQSNELIAGNGPLIVDKRSGELHPCGSAYPADVYIEAYKRTGSVDVS